ncbi:MAG TPA: AsmA family protein, partial [Rhodocyclaceae bacterium]
MKALKIVGIVVGVILILLAVAAAVILARFDKAWLKQELESAVQQKYQRTLRIDGDLGLSFYPDIGVRLEKVALSERQASGEFAAMESARVSVQLMPLLSKQLVVNRIELQGLKAQVVKRKDGSFNFDDLAGKGKEAAVKPGAEAKGEKAAPGQFDIAGIALVNSAISFSDEAKGSTLRIEQLNLRTGHLANAATGDLELSANVVENKPAV